MKLILTATVLLVALLSSHSVVAQCLEYEPKVVRLSGVLRRETYPGRPNYESIKRGDEAETIWVLRLKKSICVVTSSIDAAEVGEKNQKEIQLVLESAQYKRYRNLLRQKVIVSGTLFHWNIGHHHKPLLLTTLRMRKNL